MCPTPPSFLPSLIYHTSPGACLLDAKPMLGAGRNETRPLAQPSVPTVAPFKTGREASARGPGQPPPKLGPSGC